MAEEYDRFENEGGGGGSFVMGLLTGTVLGAGLGMLFAPKSGSELRNDLSEQAGSIANNASAGYQRATEAAGEWADRGREMYGKARDAVAKGADEAQKYVREATSSVTGTPTSSSTPSTAGPSYSSGPSYPSASSPSHPSTSEQARGGPRRS